MPVPVPDELNREDAKSAKRVNLRALFLPKAATAVRAGNRRVGLGPPTSAPDRRRRQGNRVGVQPVGTYASAKDVAAHPRILCFPDADPLGKPITTSHLSDERAVSSQSSRISMSASARDRRDGRAVEGAGLENR